MATLNSLELALRQERIAKDSFIRQSLTDAEYSIGREILMRESGWMTYRNFIIPHLTQLLAPFLKSDASISVLEVGPGPKSVLGYIPRVLRKKIGKYTAFEPNELFATRLQEWLRSTSERGSLLPGLELPPNIHRAQFNVDSKTLRNTGDEKYNVILFCHSMYGMNPKVKVIERTLEMLVEQTEHGKVIVFHRDSSLKLDGLACHRTASFPMGSVCVADDDEELDRFASFMAGFTLPDVKKYRALRIAWQKLCRAMGRRDKVFPNQLLFSAPDIMMAFTRDATAVSELTAQVPVLKEDRVLKNHEASFHCPAAIVKPTEIKHIQQCVQWAVKHWVGLTVIGGGHSGHCQWPNVASVDMGAFGKMHILSAADTEKESVSNPGVGPLIIVEAGCKTGDVIRKAMAEGLTVPLGSRPSLGAGLWLQGGIGHFSRLYGLSCDAVVGAVIVSVENGQLLCIGNVPKEHWPAGAVRPENESDLLWAIKGAGTNFGIVVSVVFKAYPASKHSVRNWRIPLKDCNEAMMKLNYLDNLIAKDLPDGCSVDGYLYWNKGQLHLGVTLFEDARADIATTASMDTLFGHEDCSKTVDGNDLFMADMYMSGMHDGHDRGKTSSFKRCIFLKDIGSSPAVDLLIKAIETRPTPLCYLHLLHGDGAVRSVASDATAFGCRDWEFACVITGVWPRDQEGPDLARTVMTWVYDVAMEFLPQCCGVYSADLGPDPRDTALVANAFGPNRPRLARLKNIADPHNVLAYACPLRRLPVGQRLIALVTGKSCAGKDYCAEVWANVFNTCVDKTLMARVVSISDVTKMDYAAANPSVDLTRLIKDRVYKEEHRPALTAFFDEQVKRRPGLLEEHFLDVVYGAMDVDVLLITGMREENPLTAYAHLVPESRLLEIRVEASSQTRQGRRGCQLDCEADDNKPTAFDSCPSLVFKNEEAGDESAKFFATRCLLPFFDEPIQRLANMVRPVPDFPREGITFQHVLDIVQQPDGLRLCTRLLVENLFDDWDQVSAIACCEAGGYIFASALAEHLNIPLALIRKAGKLPPPTISVAKFESHISSSNPSDLHETHIEMKRYLISKGSSVVVVDDVLATGKTLCAVLQLLEQAGISLKDITVLVVAEFPVHRGRALLRHLGFGAVHIRSLLVFDGA